MSTTTVLYCTLRHDAVVDGTLRKTTAATVQSPTVRSVAVPSNSFHGSGPANEPCYGGRWTVLASRICWGRDDDTDR